MKMAPPTNGNRREKKKVRANTLRNYFTNTNQAKKQTNARENRSHTQDGEIKRQVNIATRRNTGEEVKSSSVTCDDQDDQDEDFNVTLSSLLKKRGAARKKRRFNDFCSESGMQVFFTSSAASSTRSPSNNSASSITAKSGRKNKQPITKIRHNYPSGKCSTLEKIENDATTASSDSKDERDDDDELPTTNDLTSTSKEDYNHHTYLKSNNIALVLRHRSTSTNHERVRYLRGLPPPLSENVMFTPDLEKHTSSRNADTIIRKYSLRNLDTCKTVGFRSDSSDGGTRRGEITSLEFDSKGILLAAACARGTVRVYDFDELGTLDLKSRNSFAKIAESVVATSCDSVTSPQTENDQHEDRSNDTDANRRNANPINAPLTCSKQFVQPVVEIKTRKHISCVKWNPDNEDQLAVAYLSQHEAEIFDLGTANILRNSITLSHPTIPRGKAGGINSIVFMPMKSQLSVGKTASIRRNSRLLVGNNAGSVRMWSFTNPIGALDEETQRKKRHSPLKLLWSINVFQSELNKRTMNSEGVSDMILLEPNYQYQQNISLPSDSAFILIAGTFGSIVLLDPSRCTRKAFSTGVTPTLLRKYSLADMLLSSCNYNGANIKGDFFLPPEAYLGITKMCVWSYSSLKQPQEERTVDKCTQNDKREARLKLADRILSCTSISVVTVGGWTVKLRLASENYRTQQHGYQNSKFMVTSLQTTKKVIAVDQIANGQDQYFEKRSWSLPSQPCCGHHLSMFSSSILCIRDVPQTQDPIPNRDNRVLMSSSLSRRLTSEGQLHHDVVNVDMPSNRSTIKNAVLIVDTQKELKRSKSTLFERHGFGTEILCRIPTPGDCGTPSVIAVHPDDEWIVIGFNSLGVIKLLSNRRW